MGDTLFWRTPAGRLVNITSASWLGVMGNDIFQEGTGPWKVVAWWHQTSNAQAIWWGETEDEAKAALDAITRDLHARGLVGFLPPEG